MAAKERNPYFDNLKYVLITLVVVGHFTIIINDASSSSANTSMQAIRQWIYLFHMPAFLFVGGMFAKGLYKPERGLRVNTISFYLIMYILFYTALWAFNHLFGNPTWWPFYASNISWYFLAMAILGLGTPLVAKVRGGAKVVLPCMVVASFVLGFDSDMGDFMALGRVVTYAPFYYAGYFLSIQGFGDFVATCRKRIWPAVLAVVFLVAVYAWLYLAQNNDWYETMRTLGWLATGHNAYTTMKLDLWTCAGLRLVHYALASAMILATCLLVPTRKCAISDPGARTLQVYVLHPFIYYTCSKLCLLDGLAAWHPWGGFVTIAGAILLTYLLARPKFLGVPFDKLRKAIRIDKDEVPKAA